MLVIPLLIAMDFDAITGVLCTFAATQVGVACAWMGIGALESAQTIAGIPVLSGARLRMVLWGGAEPRSAQGIQPSMPPGYTKTPTVP